jgi:hypothetical protein
MNSLRAHNALRERRWRDEKRASDLLCGQAADFAQGERHLCFRRQKRDGNR